MFDWVTIPAGEFVMGSAGEGDADELPQHRVYIHTFQITRTPVTSAQYMEFVRATGRDVPGNMATKVATTRLEHPVTHVDWYDACAFAEWRGARLPTEAEWEKAARGVDGRSYPWGNQAPDATRANYNANLRTTCPVGLYPNGASPYGVLDMAGNVWEWVSSLYCDYPYQARDGREGTAAQGMRVVRGGSYIHPAFDIRSAARHRFFPSARDPYIGFRIARDV
jgi:serine/threonine-protein kinase